MREIRTSGLMSGEGKRSASRAKPRPLLDSTEVGASPGPTALIMSVLPTKIQAPNL